MHSNGRQPRPILKRTNSCHNLQEIIEASISSIYPHLATKRDEKRRCVGEDPEPRMESAVGLGNSVGGEAREWRSPSPCRCEVCPDVSHPDYFNIRFHMPETWKLSRVQVSEGKCSVCNKERRLRDLQRVSRRLSFEQRGQETEDIWGDSRDADGWKITGRRILQKSGLLSHEQEEDRRSPRLGCEEEMPTEAELDALYTGGFFGTPFLDSEDNEVAQQEPVSREAIRSEGLVHLWQDDAWEDELNHLIGEVFPYVSPPH